MSSCRRLLLAVLVLALVAACGDELPTTVAASSTSTTSSVPTSATDGDATEATAVTTTSRPVALSQISLVAEPVARFSVPTAFTARPDRTGWVAEKAGRVRSFETGTVALDIRDRVRDRGEMGFLGIAFDATGDHLYVSYNDAHDDGASVIAEYGFVGGIADPATERELLRVAQPYGNHNGGDIHLGPDGYLWIGLGDGGSAGDPSGNGQNPDTLLGAILRIDPTAPADGNPYGIPPDNPFADGGGRPEIWLIGVRNPWRFTFDSETGDLWVADVGQDAWEEITVLPAADGRGRGANLGWNHLEGTHAYRGVAPTGVVAPVFEYSHDEGCSITGGPLYRGSGIPGLAGSYLFADFCASTVRAVRVEAGVVTSTTFDVDVDIPISFGTTPDDEVLVLSQSGTVFRLRPA